jgi:adenylate cyclase
VLRERGRIEVKGKGVMHTWYLIGRKPAAAEPADIAAEKPRTSHRATV